MNIIVVDDERLALLALVEAVKEAAPDAGVTPFSCGEEARRHAETTPVEVAFLDVKMPEPSGIALAQHLKKINPQMNIIFVTAFNDYMSDAFSVYASGYILKPARAERIKRELENLRYPVKNASGARVYIKCFGGFEVFVEGRLLHMSRAKPKELLAYLVHQNGVGVTPARIAAVLWEDKPYSRSLQNQTQMIISRLMKTLRHEGIQNMIRKSWNNLAIDTDNVACDYYAFLKGDTDALNAYTGDYMSEYSWAEVTAGLLTQIKLK
ncbi:response regulator [Christensenellaceae bacterium OttesenSCG-928-M15]|nr:response regulator [Christensenellaceae bacterium OttesenSCG-928-M15]